MKIQHSTIIYAPPELVWRVTVDVERWPEWTPTVTSVVRVGGGEFGAGSIARIKQPAQPESEWVVTRFEPGRYFEWETRRFGLQMVGSHRIVAEPPGTRNTLEIRASGLVAFTLWPVLRFPMKRALAEENAGLKRRCEEIVSGERERS